ncbi:MAG: flippase [Candidatus Baldrarchaeia archaeon]
MRDDIASANREKFFEVAEESVRGGLFLASGTALGTIILAIASILIARLLGPESYGIYSISLIVPMFLIIFVDIGISPALVKYSAQFRAEGKEYMVADIIRIGFMTKVTISILLFILSFVFADVFAKYFLNRPYIEDLIRLASVLIVLQALYSTANSVFIGSGRMDWSAVVAVLQPITKLVVALLLIIWGLGVMGALLGHIAGYLMGVAVALLFVVSLYRKYAGGNCKQRMRFRDGLLMMVGYGFPLYLSNLLLNFLNQYRMIVLAWFASNFDIGNFKAAMNFLSLLGILIMPISTALFPAFSKFELDTERETLREFFGFSLKYTLLLLVPGVLFIMVVSRELVYFVYGESFVTAPLYLSLLLVMYVFSGVGTIVLTFFNGVGRTKLTLWIRVINAALMIPLLYVLTMWYGVVGLIVAMIVAWVVASACGLVIAMKLLGKGVEWGYLPGLLAAGFIAFFLTRISLSLFNGLHVFGYLADIFLAAVVFIPSYLVLVPVLGGIDGRDIKSLYLIFGKIKYVRFFARLLLGFEELILRVLGKSSNFLKRK